MNGDITLVALCHCQRPSKVISPFIIFAVFDVSFRRYKLQINYTVFYNYICCFITAACVYNIDCRYIITFEQAMTLGIGLGLIIGIDVSSTLVSSTSTSTSTLPTSTITRTRILFNDDQQRRTLHLRIQQKMGLQCGKFHQQRPPCHSCHISRPLRFKKSVKTHGSLTALDCNLLKYI